jgi:hypothetical protein
VVAKERSANLRQREQVLARCEEDEEFREDILAICAASPIAWINLFGWTYVVREHDETGARGVSGGGRHEPMITYPCQDAFIAAWIEAKAKGETILVPKSREMGASWIYLFVELHACQFTRDYQARLLSRKEDLVDDQRNPDSLLWKVRYMIRTQPAWMRPVTDDVFMRIAFPATGSAMIGESTNAYAGAGGRSQSMGVDEAAKVDILKIIHEDTHDTAGARCYISSTEPGTFFAALRRMKKYREVGLWWYDDPRRGQGRKLITDHDTGVKRWTSPWYEADTAQRTGSSAARNLDGEDSDKTKEVFSSRALDIQIRQFGKAPLFRAQVALPPGALIDPNAPASTWPLASVRAVRDDRGPWWFWKDPRILRRERRHIGIGADVARGSGASNSVISGFDVETGQKVFKFRSSRVSPEELADAIYLIGYVLSHGDTWPLVVVENNGPGGQTIARLQKLEYPAIYRHRSPISVRKRAAPIWGWPSSRLNKRLQLGIYADALARHEVQNPDIDALEEARGYTFYDDGGVGPIELVSETEDARAAHGDEVIADMLGHLAMLQYRPEAPEKPAPPPESYAWRMEQVEAEEREEEDDY